MPFQAPRALITASSRLSRLSNQISSTSPALKAISATTQQQRKMATGSQATRGKLNTGHDIPLIGFGTWQDADSQEDAVYNALKAGYRHIDTAHIYGTEPMVAKGIKKSGVPRNEIFITTKLWNNAHKPEDVEKQCDKSLANLETDYLDLYLMHWPSAFQPSDELMPRDSNEKIIPADIDFVPTFKAMHALIAKGKVRAVGVSNFAQKEVQRLINETQITPAAHQMEMHPWLQQNGFAEFHRKNGIHITHYSPFGNQNAIYSSGKDLGKLMEDSTLVEIGKKYGKNGAQVALAWGVQKGHSVIPKSKTPSRIQDNLAGDFKLTQEEMDKITAIDKKFRFNDPSGPFGYEYFSDLEGKKSS